MAATQTLSQSRELMNERSRGMAQSDEALPRKSQPNPVYIPPSEFRMKLLKRILSVDGTIDNKALKKLQRNSSERSLQANILFQNGDVGTVISFDRPEVAEDNLFRDELSTEEIHTTETKQNLPSVSNNEGQEAEKLRDDVKKERPLKLPPIVLPPIYSVTPRPLVYRDYSGPPFVPPPVTAEDWEDLQDCRYLRRATKKFGDTNPNKDRSFLSV